MAMRNYIVFLLVFMAIGCSDCTDNLSLPVEPVEFYTGFGAMATRATTPTTLDNLWTENDELAIAEVASPANIVKKYKASTTSTVSGGSVRIIPAGTVSPFFWPAEQGDKVFRGWYPYSDSQPSSVSVTSDQSSVNYKSYDIMYAPDVPVVYKQPASLIFYHQACRIVVNVNSVNTNNIVTSISMGSSNIALTKAITTLGATGEGVTSGATVWGSLSDTGNTITMCKNTENSNDPAHYASYECIVPPQSGGNIETPLFTITAQRTNSQNTLITKTYKYYDEFDFKPGYQYNYNFSLSTTGGVLVATVTVNNWGAVSIQNGEADVPDDVHDN